MRRMVQEQMEGSTGAQTVHSSRRERSDNNNIGKTDWMITQNVEGQESTGKDERTKQVAMDIDRLIMEIEETLYGTSIGVRRDAIAGQYVLIILLPWG